MTHWLFGSYFQVVAGYDTNVSSVTIYLLPCRFPFLKVSLASHEGLETQPVWVCKVMGERKVTDRQMIPNSFQFSSFCKGHVPGVCSRNFFQRREVTSMLMLPIWPFPRILRANAILSKNKECQKLLFSLSFLGQIKKELVMLSDFALFNQIQMK